MLLHVTLDDSFTTGLVGTTGRSHSSTGKRQEVLATFTYDPSLSLELTDRAAVTVQDLTYASPLGGRVPTYLVIPDGAGPYAGLIYVHPGQGDRSTFLPEAVGLAKAGVVSLLIDAPYLRPGYQPSADPTFDYRQLVVDIRRGVDLLLARPDVDPARIGYVGHSLGATWGGPLAGVERRIRAFVLMAGYPSLTDWHRNSQNGFAAMFRAHLGSPAALEQYLKPLEPLDAVHFIGQAAPAALLFQFARRDEFVSPEEAEAYFAAASEPKALRWYDSDHLFTNCHEAQADRLQWLREVLKL